MQRPLLLPLLLLATAVTAFAATPEELLQATRPDLKLAFRYCVPTTVEQESAQFEQYIAAGSLAGELVAKLPAGPDRDRLAAELYNSEKRHFEACTRWWKEFSAGLEPGDSLHRYAFDANGRLEAGLIVVRAGAIARRTVLHAGAVLPGLAVPSRYSNIPADEATLLRELAALFRPTGSAMRNGRLRLLVGERNMGEGDTCSVRYYDRDWTLTLEGLDREGYTLRLGTHTLRKSLPK